MVKKRTFGTNISQRSIKLTKAMSHALGGIVESSNIIRRTITFTGDIGLRKPSRNLSPNNIPCKQLLAFIELFNIVEEEQKKKNIVDGERN